jgi:hypothetical protein
MVPNSRCRDRALQFTVGKHVTPNVAKPDRLTEFMQLLPGVHFIAWMFVA